MKIADVGASLSMKRAHANADDEVRFDTKSHQNA